MAGTDAQATDEPAEAEQWATFVQSPSDPDDQEVISEIEESAGSDDGDGAADSEDDEDLPE